MFGAGAVFSALGGTLLQLMGVYPANICLVSANWWLTPLEQRPPVVISTNTALVLETAESKSSLAPPYTICPPLSTQQNTALTSWHNRVLETIRHSGYRLLIRYELHRLVAPEADAKPI